MADSVRHPDWRVLGRRNLATSSSTTTRSRTAAHARRADRPGHLGELARSLTSLGVVLTELRRHDEDKTRNREALTSYVRLHRRHPDRFADDVENAKRNMV